MHCNNAADTNIRGKELGDFFCSPECKLEDELRQKAGLNDDVNWRVKTHLDKDKKTLVIDSDQGKG